MFDYSPSADSRIYARTSKCIVMLLASDLEEYLCKTEELFRMPRVNFDRLS